MSDEDEFTEEEDDGSDSGDEESVKQDKRGSLRVYDYVNITPSADGTKKEQACMFCGYKNVSRKFQPGAMGRHLILCTECPHSAKMIIAKSTKSREVRAAAITAGLLPSDANVIATWGRRRNSNTAASHQIVTPVSIRSYVKIVNLPNGRIDQQCIFCEFNREAPRFNATLMSKHIIQCPFAPLEAKCIVAKNSKSEEVETAAKDEGLIAENDPLNKPSKGPKADTYTNVSILPNGKRAQRCIFCGQTKELARFNATFAALHAIQCTRAPAALKMAIAQHARSNEVAAAARAAGVLIDDSSTPQILGQGAGKRAKSLGGESGGAMVAGIGSMEPLTKRKRASGGNFSAPLMDQATININLMKLIAGCALPLGMVDSPHFFTFVQSLNKEYIDQNWLPKANALVTDWMPKLYQTIHNDIQMMWKAEGNAKRTMGVDTFIDDLNNKVFIFSEGLLDKICFSFVQVTSKDEANADYVADLLIKRLEATAEAAEKTPEDMFCAVTFDNLVENLEATKKVQEKFPKILMNGCRTRCMILLNSDIYRIPEISQLMEDVESVLNFIVSNPSVTSAYKRAAKKAGAKKIKASSIKIEPGTKIGVASDIKIDVLLGPEDKNVDVLTQLITADPQRWVTIVENLPDHDVEAFTNLMLDKTFVEKVKAFRQFSKPLRLLTEHFESTEARASWICRAFEAFWTDVDSWCNETSIQHLFERDTLSQVKKIVDQRWVGEGNVKEGLYSEEYFLAAILDPATLPEVEYLPQNWLPQCEEILSRFYDEKELDSARRELMHVVLRQGYWGDQVNKVQDTLRSSVPDNLKLATEKVIYIQSSNAHERPHLLWQAVYKSHFPHLEGIATRLLVMSTQCGQVERACSRNNIYSKLKSKMENPTVQQLLYCHINLRLACNEDAKEYEGFLDQAILDIGKKEEKNTKRIADEEDHSRGVGGGGKVSNINSGAANRENSGAANREFGDLEDGDFEEEGKGFLL